MVCELDRKSFILLRSTLAINGTGLCPVRDSGGQPNPWFETMPSRLLGLWDEVVGIRAVLEDRSVRVNSGC